jgi:outer membrane protein assembly factor BamD (BamD/ComL family)
LAQAQFENRQFKESIQTLEKLGENFPNSSYFYDARLVQARDWVELGNSNLARRAYLDVLSVTNSVSISYELATVILNPEQQLAAYQRIVLLSEPNSENLPVIEASLWASIPLCLKQQKYELALSCCDQFLARFPDSGKVSEIGTFKQEALDALAP